MMATFDLQLNRMISFSKTSPPGEVCVFNANLCTKSRGKFWYGDLNLTRDLEQLQLAAKEQDEDIYVLRESDARFDTEHAPRFENAVARIDINGKIYMKA